MSELSAWTRPEKRFPSDDEAVVPYREPWFPRTSQDDFNWRRFEEQCQLNYRVVLQERDLLRQLDLDIFRENYQKFSQIFSRSEVISVPPIKKIICDDTLPQLENILSSYLHQATKSFQEPWRLIVLSSPHLDIEFYQKLSIFELEAEGANLIPKKIKAEVRHWFEPIEIASDITLTPETFLGIIETFFPGSSESFKGSQRAFAIYVENHRIQQQRLSQESLDRQQLLQQMRDKTNVGCSLEMPDKLERRGNLVLFDKLGSLDK